MEKIKVNGLFEYNELSNNIDKIQDKLHTLFEEEVALRKEKEYYTQEEVKLTKDRYECADKVVEQHYFWINKEKTSVARIIRLPSPELSLAYISERWDGVSHEFHTSSVGFLMRYPTPITEKEYNEIVDKYKGIIPIERTNYFDRKCGKIDGRVDRNEKREKELRKEICDRWAALGFTDELGAETRKKLTELLEGQEEGGDRFPIVIRYNNKFPLYPPEIDNPFKNN